MFKDTLLSFPCTEFIMYCFCQNETLIAIKAPHGTTLEVPDPDEVVPKRTRYNDSLFIYVLLYSQ